MIRKLSLTIFAAICLMFTASVSGAQSIKEIIADYNSRCPFTKGATEFRSFSADQSKKVIEIVIHEKNEAINLINKDKEKSKQLFINSMAYNLMFVNIVTPMVYEGYSLKLRFVGDDAKHSCNMVVTSQEVEKSFPLEPEYYDNDPLDVAVEKLKPSIPISHYDFSVEDVSLNNQTVEFKIKLPKELHNQTLEEVCSAFIYFELKKNACNYEQKNVINRIIANNANAQYYFLDRDNDIVAEMHLTASDLKRIMTENGDEENEIIKKYHDFFISDKMKAEGLDIWTENNHLYFQMQAEFELPQWSNNMHIYLPPRYVEQFVDKIKNISIIIAIVISSNKDLILKLKDKTTGNAVYLHLKNILIVKAYQKDLE
ncbi:MAG: hypothetical protein J6V76_01870 [Bacteroidales bacterium]|nr:hypothetical protein [Bacteroidales bacterium]